MNENTVVYAPRIRVGSILFDRQDDGSYTANVVRAETAVLEGTYDKGDWTHRAKPVPWDVRVGQYWLHTYPNAWEPAK